MLSILRSQRTDPFGDFDRLFDGLLARPIATDACTVSDFVPPVEVAEDEAGYTVRAEVPGLEPADVEAWIEGDTLTLRGEKKAVAEPKESRVHRTERRYGKFLRVVQFPVPVDAEQVAATHRNGVLQVRVPKSAKARGRSIEIRAGE